MKDRASCVVKDVWQSLGGTGVSPVRALAVVLALSCGSAFAQVRHWRGTTSSLASVAENWAESAVPVAGDSIILDADSGSNPLTWDLDISLSSWTQTPDYSGAVTFCTGRAEDATTHGVMSADGKTKELRITGNVVLAGGTWTTPEQPSFYEAHWRGEDIPAWNDGNGIYRFVARIGGALTVAADAAIDVTGKGFQMWEGPGSGSHAGFAGYGIDIYDYDGYRTSARECTYGSIKKPVTIGSGGDDACGVLEFGCPGGGGIELEVTGAAMINGALLADGIGTGHEDDSWSSYQPGAGGAVWLKAAALKGAGTISASHGYVMYTGGSGGRISVVLTGEGETFSSWAGEFRTTDAFADWDMWFYNYSTAGTIYLEEAGLNGVGDLILKDGNTYDADECYWANYEDGRLYFQTPMTPDDPEDTHFRDVSLLNGAILGLPSNAVLKVDRALITDPREMDEWEELYFYQIDHVVFDGGEIDLPAAASIPNVTIHVQAPGSVVKAGDGTGTFSFMPNNECKFDYGMVVDGNVSVGEGVSFSLGGPLTVNGNMNVAQGAYLSMPYAGNGNNSSLDPALADLGYRLAVTVAGDFTVAAGGFVSADYAGYYNRWSPSGFLSNANVADGGSYGGLAAHASGEQGVYGSVTEPTDLGAGGGGARGGGVVRLAVAGTCTVNGTVSANGLNASTGGAGSGGSIWITCGQLVGGSAAIIRANGGNCNDTKATDRSHGGGGRIAIHLTGAGDFSQYLGTIQSFGGFVSVSGAQQGGAGTVYLKKQDGSSTLVVDNGAAATYPNRAATSSPTPLTAEMTAQAFGDVTVRNTAWLCPEAGCSLQVAGSLTTENAAPETIGEKGSSVTLVDASKESVLRGALALRSLVCETPGKSIVLDAAAGSEVSVAPGGVLYLAGDAQSPVAFGNSTAQGKFTLPNGAVAEVRHATIAGVDSSGGVGVVADNSCALGERVVNWTLADMTPGENTWTGASSSVWSDGRNWSLGRPPLEGDTVVIGAGVKATLAGDIAVGGLTVSAGAEFDLGGRELLVNGNVMISGTVENAATSTLLLDGANVTAALNGTKFGAVMVVSGKVAFTQGFGADTFKANAPDCTEVAFAAGETFAIDRFKVSGTVNGAAAIALKSTVAGTAWTLNVGSSAEVSGAVISDSTAQALDSFLVVDRHPSVDGGNNRGWTFGGPVPTTGIPTSAYIQDGLIALYDSIENAGPGLHDATPEKWVNLAEGSDDIPLKAGYHVFGDKSLVLKRERIAGADLPGVRNASSFTYEAYVKMNNMAGGANDMPCLTADTKGGIGHDTRPENGFCGFAASGSNWGSQKAYYGWFSKRYRSIDIAYAYHTLASSGSATGYLDGESLTRSGSWTASTASAAPDGNVYIGNASVEYEFGCARVYSRALTANEAMINANIDKMRFAGADPDKLTWPEEYRWRNGKLMRRVRIECDPRYGTVSIDGGEPQSGLIELFFEARPGSSASTSVTLTATPTARATGFRTWQGSGISNQRNEPTVTLTVTLDPKVNSGTIAKKVEALFNADDIHYVSSASTSEFNTLADALNSDSVQDGHTIYILDGTYTWAQAATRVYNRIQTGVDSKGNPSYTTVEDKDYTCIAAVRKGVTIMGSDPSRVILDCSKQGGGLVVSNENAVIANLTIKKFQNVNNMTTMALNMNCGTITNCIIDNTSQSPYSVAAAPRVIWLGPRALMTDCVVQKINKVARNAWSNATILQMHGGTIRRTKFHDNYTFNAVVKAVAGDGKRPRFDSCDFYDNYAWQFGGIDGSNVDIVDCTFIGASTPQGNYNEGSLNQLSGNCSLVRTVVKGTRVTTSAGDPKMFQCAAGAHVSLTNCLIAKNQVNNWGVFHLGGKGTVLELYNTTVANNNTVAAGKAGALTGDGTSAGRATVKLVNSIIWGNTCNGEEKNFLDDYPYTDFIFDHSCFAGREPGPGEEGNTAEDPMFIAEGGDWHLGAGSSCINAGKDMTGIVMDDLDGKERPIDGVGYGDFNWDIGCYEADGPDNPLQVTFFTDGEFGVAPCDATQRVVVVGSRLSGLEYEWWAIRDYAGTLSTNRQVTTTKENVFSNLGPGRYTLVSIVRNDQGDAVTNIAENAFLSAVETCYVGPNGSELWPYDTPETATKSVFAAVETAASRVIILPGTYASKPQMDELMAQDWQAVDRRGLVIEGPADPSLAVIDCGGKGGIRLESKASFLSGVTFRNFLTTKGSGPALSVVSGAASNVVVDAGSQTGAVNQPCVYVGDVSLVTDSVIENLNGTVSGCKAASVVGGTLRRTTVRNCTATASAMITGDASSGGSRAKFEDCVFTGNTQTGSSVFSINRTDATGCKLGHNTITSKGYELVWTQESTLTDCALTNNTAKGTLLVNTIWGSGGTRIKNSLIAYNDNGSWAAVFNPYTSSRMWLENCTIAWNKSTSGAAGGLDGVADSYDSFIDIKNTIVAGNTVGSKVIDTSAKHKTYNNRRFTYSAFAEAANYPDANNVADPLMKKNCKLKRLSPCRDTGTPLSWHEGGHDLDGNPRIIDSKLNLGGGVDMGCYECPPGTGLLLLVH